MTIHRVRGPVFTALLSAVVCGAIFLPVKTLSADPSGGSPRVLRAWSRATLPGVPVGVAYFEIVNSGAADELTAIESPVAESVEMHSMQIQGGVMHMRSTRSVDIPAEGRVVFEPHGLHAMLIDLKQPLSEGVRFPLTLIFRHAGRIRVEAIIQGIGAMTPPAATHAQYH